MISLSRFLISLILMLPYLYHPFLSRFLVERGGGAFHDRFNHNRRGERFMDTTFLIRRPLCILMHKVTNYMYLY